MNVCLRVAQFGHLLWSCPLQIIVAVVLLFNAIGPSALAGVAVMVLAVPLQGKIARKLSQLRELIIAFTDERVKIMNEVLQLSLFSFPFGVIFV